MTSARLPELFRLLALVVCTVLFSAVGLDRVPAYLHDAEIQFALHARSIAATGYDTNGRFLPLYFQMPAIGDDVWFHPFIVYWTAPLLTILPFAESTVRFASVLIGAANVALAYFVAARLFKAEWQALLAALFTALTPAHFIHSRLAMDYVYPVPFVLTWLWCLALFADRRQPRYLYAGCIALGAGVYSYIASVAMMPLYLLITAGYAWRQLGFSLRRTIAMLGCFVAPLLPAVLWLAAHPMVVTQTIGRYVNTSSSLVGTILRLRDSVRYDRVQENVSIFWDYFNPGYLFFAGGSNLVNSTRSAGVFLLPIAVFLAVGLYQASTRQRTLLNLVLVAGFVTSPLAATFVGERYAVDRELGIIPFATLLSVLGCCTMWDSRQRLVRWAGAALLVALPTLFAFFYADYMGDYRIRSVGAFEFNIKGAAEELIARAGAEQRFYLSKSIAYARTYWRFYLAKAGVESLDGQTSVIDPNTLNPADMPPHSLIMGHVEDTALRALSETGELRLVQTVPELGRDPLFVIYER